MYFKTENITLPIRHLTVKLTIINNIDDLFDALIQKGLDHKDVVDERIPYWAELWASAIAMAHYLVEKNIVTEGVRVTEIGCGLGLPAIVAGLLGGEVTLTDYLDEAVDFAQLNWQQNLPTKNAQFKKLDWRNPDPSVAADVLLASDVAYEERAFEPLLNAFKTLLKPNGTIIITEPNRFISKNFFSNLPERLLKMEDTEGGYDLTHSTMTIERKEHLHRVNIYELRKK